jgi:phosphatidylglycerophosphate synthase
VILRAYLVADPEVRAERIVAGLPALLRQILSLQAAGVADVVLVGVVSHSFHADQRVRIRVRAAAELPEAPDERALLAVAGAVWTPAYIRAFLRAPVPADSRFVPVPADPRVILPRTQNDVNAATTMLMQSLYKPTDGIVSRHVNRRISLAISRRLLPLDVTPNQMTATATVFGLAGVMAVFRGGYLPMLAGALLLQVQSLLDGCDGEIARIKYLHSRAGEWLDQVADDVLNIAFLAAAGAALGRAGHAFAWRIAVASIGCQIVYMAALYAGLIFKSGGRGSVATLRWWVDKPGPSSAPSHIVGDLARRDFICFFYFVCALFDAIGIALLWHAMVTIVSAAVTTVGWIAFGGPDSVSP